MQPILDKAARQHLPEGNYTATVRFVVEVDGLVSNVIAKNDPGFGLAEGAVKTVATGPKWAPAIKMAILYVLTARNRSLM